jgi:uncharacterized membrane protein
MVVLFKKIVMKLKLSQFISLFLLMLVTGIFWGTWFSLSRSMEVFSVEEFIHIGKTIIANLAVPMSIIMPLCILFMLLSMWLYPEKKSAGFYLSITAFIFIIISLLVTLLVEVPIDNQIKVWTASTVPADWKAIRNHWEVFHTTRTFTSLASFGFFSAAIFKSIKINQK